MTSAAGGASLMTVVRCSSGGGLQSRGGGVLPYVCILGMCRARDPHFQPWISVPEHIIFTNFQKSVPEHHHFTFFGGFCRSGDHHFQNFFNFNPFIASHGRLSPNAAPRVSQTRPGSSGESHFHAKNGSSSFRSPPIFHARPGARSGALANFSLCRGNIPTKIWGEYPPPPPGGGGGCSTFFINRKISQVSNNSVAYVLTKFRCKIYTKSRCKVLDGILILRIHARAGCRKREKVKLECLHQ